MTAEIAGEIFFSISESVRLRSRTKSTTRIWSAEMDGSLESMKSTHLRAVLVDGNNIACSPGVPTFLMISSAKAAISLWMKNLGGTSQSLWQTELLELQVNTLGSLLSTCSSPSLGPLHIQYCRSILGEKHLSPVMRIRTESHASMKLMLK